MRSLYPEWEGLARSVASCIRMEAAHKPDDRRLAELVGEITLDWDPLTSDAEPDQQLIHESARSSADEAMLMRVNVPSALRADHGRPVMRSVRSSDRAAPL
jgi:MmyB-like transcription regulator ligand binding domain